MNIEDLKSAKQKCKESGIEPNYVYMGIKTMKDLGLEGKNKVLNMKIIFSNAFSEGRIDITETRID